MLAENYEFTLFVSKQNFKERPENKSKIAEIVFEPQLLNAEKTLKLALKGKSFCYNFTTNPEGVLPIGEKKDINYLFTQVIFFDFDNMSISMNDFIDTLIYKPSFAYTSFRDGIEGCRYRLIYVLNEIVYGYDNFISMYDAIGNANKFIKENKDLKIGGWDYRGPSQFYFGTKPSAQTFISNNIYSIEQFRPFIVTTDKGVKTTSCRNAISSTNNTDVKVDKDFLNDFHNLNSGKLINKYFEKYYDAYLQSLETDLELSDDEMYFVYPDDYLSVPRKRNGKYTLKWDIGEDRKKKLYVSAQIMLYNNPDMTIENLLFNLVIERRWYYENGDNKIDNDVIYNTAVNAYANRITLKSSNHGTFKVNKEFWEEQGISVYQAMGYIRREMHVKEILPYIDKHKSIKENYNNLISNGFSISISTLYRMVSSGCIEIIKQHPPTTLLSKCEKQYRNSDTIQQVIELIRGNDEITEKEIANILNVKPITIKRAIKKVRGILIDREGNNRSGKWVLIGDAACEDADTGVKEKDPCMGSLIYSNELSSVEGLFSTLSQYAFNPADMAVA